MAFPLTFLAFHRGAFSHFERKANVTVKIGRLDPGFNYISVTFNLAVFSWLRFLLDH
jgi:hypothetical protein